MSVTSVNPDGTTANTGALTGGATAHAVLADSSDATYVLYDPGETSIVTFANPSIPAGARVKSYSVILRASGATSPPPYLLAALGVGDGHAEKVTLVSWGSVNQWLALQLADRGWDPDTAELRLLRTDTDPSGAIAIRKARLDVTYVAKPVANITAPTGTLSEDNRPTVTWTHTLDADGGPQIAAQVRVFTEAQYSAGGFDPDSSPAFAETGFYGAATSWRLPEMLANGEYRSHVRVAQSVNGQAHWSDFDSEDFAVDVLTPGTPGITAINDPDSVRIELAASAGATDTDGFVVERRDGEEWVGVRTTIDDDGTVTGDEATIYDYEGTPGEVSRYRVRAFHTFASGTTSWSETAEASTPEAIDYGRWSVRHPTMPWLNGLFDLRSFASQGRQARQTIVQPLGRSDAVAISDSRGPETGSITFRVPDDSTRDQIKALAGVPSPLYLLPPAGHHEPARWVVFGSEEITRLIDKSWADERDATYEWTVVGRPSDPVVGWPGLYPSDDLYPADDLYPY